MIPPNNALSVECPLYTSPKDPWSKKCTLVGVASKIALANWPILAAPAVCELDGPTITGPAMSKTEKLVIWGFNRSKYSFKKEKVHSKRLSLYLKMYHCEIYLYISRVILVAKKSKGDIMTKFSKTNIGFDQAH